MKVPLIIGAAGQVGHQLSQLLESQSPVLTARNPVHTTWKSFDLASAALRPSEADSLLDSADIGAVYCVGGATDVERCESEQELAYLVNEKGPSVLAAAAAKRSFPFVYFSTEYVFDGYHGPYQENDLVNPLSVYGKSKLAGELSVRNNHPNALIVRTTVVYGADCAKKNFLYGLLSKLPAGIPIAVAEDQISTPTYNQDLARATITLMQSGANGTYHVCGPELLSRYEFAKRAAAVMGLPSSLITPKATSALKQIAPRPLSAGLSTTKLLSHFPNIHMRGAELGIQDFFSTHLAP